MNESTGVAARRASRGSLRWQPAVALRVDLRWLRGWTRTKKTVTPHQALTPNVTHSTTRDLPTQHETPHLIASLGAPAGYAWLPHAERLVATRDGRKSCESAARRATGETTAPESRLVTQIFGRKSEPIPGVGQPIEPPLQPPQAHLRTTTGATSGSLWGYAKHPYRWLQHLARDLDSVVPGVCSP